MESVVRHKQFQKCISIRIVSVPDWLAQVDEQEDIVYGHANDHDESYVEDCGGRDGDDNIDWFHFSAGV